MKHIIGNKTRLLFATGCAFALLATTGCIREDMDACPSHKLTVKVVTPLGDEFTESASESLNEVTVFIFDESGTILKKEQLSGAQVDARKLIDLPAYQEGKKMYAVAWGNAYSGNQTVTGENMLDQLRVSLKTSSTDKTLANLPDELFQGDTTIIGQELTAVEVVDTVTIMVQVGQLRILSLNMPERLKAELKEKGLKADGGIAELYVNKTLGTWDQKGELVGDSIYYMPDAERGLWEQSQGIEELNTEYHYYAEKEKLEVRLNIPLPNGQGFDSSLFTDAENGDIIVTRLEPTDVIFTWGEDGTYLGVRVVVRPWGYVPDPHEW